MNNDSRPQSLTLSTRGGRRLTCRARRSEPIGESSVTEWKVRAVAEVRVIAFLVEAQLIMTLVLVTHTPILAFKSSNVTDFSPTCRFRAGHRHIEGRERNRVGSN